GGGGGGGARGRRGAAGRGEGRGAPRGGRGVRRGPPGRRGRGAVVVKLCATPRSPEPRSNHPGHHPFRRWRRRASHHCRNCHKGSVDSWAMCGIISVVRGPGLRRQLDGASVTTPLRDALDALAVGGSLAQACDRAAVAVEGIDRVLRTTDGVGTLVYDRGALLEVEGLAGGLCDALATIEAQLDSG